MLILQQKKINSFKESYIISPLNSKQKKNIFENKGKSPIFLNATKQENTEVFFSGGDFKLKKKIQKKLLNGYSKIHELKLVTIGLASPEKIQSWAEKELPNGKIFGEVTNANTFHYRTFKPSKGGLFCERIFGPLKDFSCACGKGKKPTAIESKKILEHEQTSRTFCSNCDVEYTWSILRRYQLGFIKLNAPVAHLWYFKTSPSYLSILFDLKKKDLESIIYCTQTITLENTWKYSEQNSNLTRSPTDLYQRWQKFFSIEEKTKEHQLILQNKKQKQQKKKKNYRTHFLTTNTFEKQINWQKFVDENSFLFSENSKSVVSSIEQIENLKVFSFLTIKKKLEILLNISKQKQKKLMSFTIQKFWKNFIQKSYQKSFIFYTFFEFDLFFSNDQLDINPNRQIPINKHLQKNIQNFSLFFFFSYSLMPENFFQNKKIKKYNRFFSISEKSIFENFYFLKKAKIIDTFYSSSFLQAKNFYLNIEKNLQILNKEKICRKKFWKFFFFLLEFGICFLRQKNKKLKNSFKLSKKDLLFLFNLLPSLKKWKTFQKMKFRNKNLKKIQFFLENSMKKKKYQIFPNIYDKISSIQNIQFEIQKIFVKQKFCYSKSNLFLFSNFKIPTKKFFVVRKNFVFENNQINWLSIQDKQFVNGENLLNLNNPTRLHKLTYEMKLSDVWKQIKKINLFCLKTKIDFIQTKQIKEKKFVVEIMKISSSFEKILNVLKTYYEIDFCSIFYNSILFSSIPEKTNTLKKLYETDKNFIFQKNVNDFFDLEKKIEMFIQNSQIYSIIDKISFEYFTFILYTFKSNLYLLTSSNNNIETLNKNSENKKENIHLFIENIKSKNSLFFLLNYFSFLFFSHLKFDKVNKKSIQDTKCQSNNTFQENFENKQLKIKKEKIYISNKLLTSKQKLNKQNKQIQLNKFLKFFYLNSSIEQNPISKKKKIQKILKIGQNQVKKKKRKANFEIFAGVPKTKSIVDLPRKTQISSNTPYQNITKIKASILKTNTFLKNKVLTIAYNYIWNNDAEWNYFVYYNSLFLYEFEDMPIFIYRSISTLTEKSRSSTKMKNVLFKEAFSRSKKKNESFLPFFDFSIDFSTKNFFVGAGIFEKLLTEYTSVELRKMTIQHQNMLPKIQQTLQFFKQKAKTKKDTLKIQKYFQKREHIIRRLKFLRKFSRRNSNPCFMILRNLPVLPPDLRPILKLQNQIAASDLNRFYQRIIFRNERFKKFAKDSATNQSFEIKYAQRLLQEAVDNLIQNGKGNVKAETNSRGQPLKSLSETLKGKQGRFRQYLLGKRVDYSGRSVIVVGPELKLYECGIPKEMAFELFLPFLIQFILKYKLAQTVIGAKNVLKSDSTFTLHLLQKVIKNVPVLLNRAPTLHKLGFQAFLPKLIDGRAILLHPMVCPAFNADFDGDQMAVHIPLTVEARTEAWKFMLSINNFINSATGEAIFLPSQDMVLGCYYLTNDFLSKFVGIQFSNFLKKKNSIFKQKGYFTSPVNFYQFVMQNKSFLFFQNFSSVITAYQNKEIFIHTPIWLGQNNSIDFGNDSSKPIEIRLQLNGNWEKIQPKYMIIYNRQNNILNKYIRTTVGRVLMNLMIQECIHRKSF